MGAIVWVPPAGEAGLADTAPFPIAGSVRARSARRGMKTARRGRAVGTIEMTLGGESVYLEGSFDAPPAGAAGAAPARLVYSICIILNSLPSGPGP